MLTGIVQRGSVHVGTAWPFATDSKIYFPGQAVSLSVADFDRLVACGPLQNPDEAAQRKLYRGEKS